MAPSPKCKWQPLLGPSPKNVGSFLCQLISQAAILVFGLSHDNQLTPDLCGAKMCSCLLLKQLNSILKHQDIYKAEKIGFY